MAEDKEPADPKLRGVSIDDAATVATIPLAARLAHEIPIPKDWQAFQRNCVLLFRDELNDPHAQEYGRGGQKQGGIDILGRRDGNPDHLVGIQCRKVAQPLTKNKMLKDCREALDLEADLKEIIFATTAPIDVKATDAALAIEQTLRSEGHDLQVVVYGWAELQTRIVIHDVAYAAFFPSIVATSAQQAPITILQSDFIAKQIAEQVGAILLQSGVTTTASEVDASNWNKEDPPLHAKIDFLRDLMKKEGQPLIARKGLLELQDGEWLDQKPWARFRIETNLAAIAIEFGNESEAAERYETAYAIRPDNSNAIANLALARTIQGQFEEAMSLAERALNASPRADHAIAYLLQAAARSTWEGDPEALIPPDLVGSTPADIGMAEFLRRREIAGWAERILEICARHPDTTEFEPVHALATFALATEMGAFLFGGNAPVTLADLNRAADNMKSIAEHRLDIGFTGEHDLVASLNNAAALLHLVDREAECETLLKRGLDSAPNEVSLLRHLALAQMADGRRHDALATLEPVGDDAESRLLKADLVARDDPDAGLALALAIDPDSLNEHLDQMRWRLIGEIALKAKDSEKLDLAVEGLRKIDETDVTARLLDIRRQQMAGLDHEAAQELLRELAATLPPDLDMFPRFLVADELFDQDLPEEASTVLEEHVDLARIGLATLLYLQSLAQARRDDVFRDAIERAGPDVRDDPQVLLTVASHAWNVGDLPGALHAIDTLLAEHPNNPRARLLKIEILIRQDQSSEVLAELDQPLEDFDWARLQDRFRIASLLGHFGFVERAVPFAYRLFLEHRDNPQAWMALSMLVLNEGGGPEDAARPLDAPVVASDVAVDLIYDDGREVFFVIEPDENLRKVDQESWEPDHPLIQSVMGLREEERFEDPSGGTGKIVKLRHKYVARFHYVLQHFEARFPTVQGFRRVQVDTEKEGGLDELTAELKARHDWIQQELERYRNGPWPIGVFAHRIGTDVIDAANGLASQGVPLKVSLGNLPEREAATEAILKNAKKGCVLDLQTFWTAWQLQALDAVASICGRVLLTQSVLDRLHARRERLENSAKYGGRSASYERGKIVFYEATPELIAGWRDDVDRAIAWAEANATICPLVANDHLPSVLRDHLRTRDSDIFDGIILAIQTGKLLLSDDLSTRELLGVLGGGGAAWLHQVLGIANDLGNIDLDAYVRWSAALFDAGQQYLGTTGKALIEALRIDARDGQAPGNLYKTLVSTLGGREADPVSHVTQAVICLRGIWSDSAAAAYQSPATGLLLQKLVRERNDDYREIIQTIIREIGRDRKLAHYVREWVLGHFLSDALDASIPTLP